MRFGILPIVLLILCLADWVAIICSRSVRRYFWPAKNARPRSWTIQHVLLVWILFFFCGLIVDRLIPPVTEVTIRRLPTAETSDQTGQPDWLNRAHWVVVFLQSKPSWGMMALCFITTGLLVPTVEEILHRFFLQSWLYRKELAMWRRVRWRFRPVGLQAVAASTALFAFSHIRPAAPPPAPEIIGRLFVVQLVAYLLFLIAVGTFFARKLLARTFRPRQAPCAGENDLLSRGKKRVFVLPKYAIAKFIHDVVLAAGWFLASLIPIYGLQAVLTTTMPQNVVVDPLTMVLVGGILGTLFLRTGRVVPCIVFHSLLNTTSLIMALSV